MSTHKTACVVDVDNLVLRTNQKKLALNVEEMGQFLRKVDAEKTAYAFAGSLPAKQIHQLREAGITVILTRRNADDDILAQGKELIRSDYHLVVVTGDGELCKALGEAARKGGTSATFYAKRCNASRKIRFDGYVDGFVVRPEKSKVCPKNASRRVQHLSPQATSQGAGDSGTLSITPLRPEVQRDTYPNAKPLEKPAFTPSRNVAPQVSPVPETSTTPPVTLVIDASCSGDSCQRMIPERVRELKQEVGAEKVIVVADNFDPNEHKELKKEGITLKETERKFGRFCTERAREQSERLKKYSGKEYQRINILECVRKQINNNHDVIVVSDDDSIKQRIGVYARCSDRSVIFHNPKVKKPENCIIYLKFPNWCRQLINHLFSLLVSIGSKVPNQFCQLNDKRPSQTICRVQRGL